MLVSSWPATSFEWRRRWLILQLNMLALKAGGLAQLFLTAEMNIFPLQYRRFTSATGAMTFSRLYDTLMPGRVIFFYLQGFSRTTPYSNS